MGWITWSAQIEVHNSLCRIFGIQWSAQIGCAQYLDCYKIWSVQTGCAQYLECKNCGAYKQDVRNIWDILLQNVERTIGCAPFWNVNKNLEHIFAVCAYFWNTQNNKIRLHNILSANYFNNLVPVVRASHVILFIVIASPLFNLNLLGVHILPDIDKNG